METATPAQLRFPAIAGFTVRGDFEGGALSSDFGALLLHGVDRQTGLVNRLSAAIRDQRHASYIEHSIADLLRQRVFQTACGYVDGNDANSLRHDPVFKLATERAPLDGDNALASGPTFSRLENSLSRRDIYRLAQAFVDAFIASYAAPPAMIVLDMDHSEDRTRGQQELDPAAELLYRDLCCARGQDENFIKAIKNDLGSDRTSDHSSLANHLRLFYACAAYSVIHSLREHTLCDTELAKAQPMSIILKRFKLAVRVVQYKDRITLHLPNASPMKGLLQRVTELRFHARPPAPA